MEAIKNGLRKNLTPAQLWSGARFFLLLNLGLIIYAVALNFYCAPNHFVFGGTTGLSIVLATCFPALSVSTFMWITNAVLDVLGCVFLGIKTMGWTLYSSFMLSFYSSMCEKMFPVSQPLTDDTLLELCFAVALPAIASGIVFNIGASTGGTEIVAMILHKYIKVEIGRALLLSDIGTVLFAAYLYGPQTGMYCVLGLIGRSTIVDTAIESLNLRKVCTVITSRPEPIRHFVTETLGRTATQQNATGVYTGEPRTMIMVALTRRQAGLLRDFLRREDPEVPLIVFTIEDNQRVADQFLDAGASDFVLKPVKALDIIARIKLHVRLVESRRENRQSTEEPVKGIGQGTLSLIEGYLRSVSEYQPVEAIAEGTGLAYQTTYRYLQYLVSVNRVEVSQHYGKVGRPKQRYRMIREAGDGEKPETGL